MSRIEKEENVDSFIPRGFYRLKIVEPRKGRKPKVVGDSGWRKNVIVTGGYQDFIQFAMVGSAGSKTVTHAAIGTGTQPGTSDTTLAGELVDAAGCRCAITTGTAGSRTVTFTFTLASGITTAAHTIQNVGLFNGSTTNTGTLFAGNTYATSSFATNQAINGTYQITF